jgi:DeoR/GlpR family transcriptional regulator of sugar metabolism
MIERTQMVIAVADDTKVGFESFYYIGDVRAVNKLITNAGFINEEELQKLEAAGICICRC